MGDILSLLDKERAVMEWQTVNGGVGGQGHQDREPGGALSVSLSFSTFFFSLLCCLHMNFIFKCVLK